MNKGALSRYALSNDGDDGKEEFKNSNTHKVKNALRS
jgi:hypothetical protein